MITRYLRSKSKRADLFLSTDGLCSICKKPLPVSWHSDHIIPWAKNGLTTMSNLQPVCPKCNQKKGDKMPNKINYENLNYFQEDFPNNKGMRLCQIAAYNAVIHSLVVQKKLSCSIFLPTGTGKSDLARAISIGLKKRSHCSGVWCFSPTEGLRTQIAKDEIKECLERLGVSFPKYYPFSEETSLDNDRFRNDCIMESFTTQFLINGSSKKTNLDRFIEHDKRIFKKTGKHVVAIFDESHLFSTDNTWGDAAIRLQEMGVPIVLITGTPYRTDKIKIPGFEQEFKDETEKSFVKTTISDGTVKIKRGKEKITRWKLVADYEYTYSQAWDDGVILRPNPQWIDATEMTFNKILSEMPKGESSKLLRKFLLDDKTISSAVSATIESICRRKTSDSNCCAIVTTLSDSDDVDSTDVKTDNEDDMLGNLHARKIEREFRRQNPHLRVRIVTSSLNSNDLEKFKDGQYDILIVKAMGTIGFNHKPIKTVCHLSSYRTLPALIQLLMRGCRVYGSHRTFDAILTKDKALRDLWMQLEEETGLVIEDREEIESHTETKPIKESDNDSETKISVFDNHNYSYEINKNRDRSDEIIELYRKKDPQLSNILKPQELLNHFNLMANSLGDNWLNQMPDYRPPETTSVMLDPNEEEYRKRTEAKESVQELANEIMLMCNVAYSKATFGKYIAPVWKCVKRISGFPPAASMENISGIENYRKIVEACRHVKEKLNSETESDYFDHFEWLSNIRSIR